MRNWKQALLASALAFASHEINSTEAFSSSFTVAKQKLSTSSTYPLRRIHNRIRPSTRTLDQLCPTCEPEMLDLSTEVVNPLTQGLRAIPSETFDERSPLFQKPLQVPTLSDVTISLLPSDEQHDGLKSLPLVISPRHDSSLSFLSDFLENNRVWLDQQMEHYGAILLRGFDLRRDNAEDVQSAIQAYQPTLNNSYRGTSPRSTQQGSEYVFSAAEVPSYYPIAQHLEMSFLPAPPKQLFFSALKAPKTKGGETALADFRKVYRDIPQPLREKLATKKILYRRSHNKVGAKGWFTRDVASMQGWPDVFGTTSKREVERLAKSEKMPMRWEGRNGDTFVSETVEDPFQLHPQTREPVWFNHAQVFHWTTFPAELLFAFRRTKDLRLLLHAVWVTLFSVVRYGLLRQKIALQSSFGDGTPISIKEMSQIRHAIHKNMIFNRWEQGDILMIDNFSTSHGRQPTYDTGRKVVVAWSDPITKANDYDLRSQKRRDELVPDVSAWQ